MNLKKSLNPTLKRSPYHGSYEDVNVPCFKVHILTSNEERAVKKFRDAGCEIVAHAINFVDSENLDSTIEKELAHWHFHIVIFNSGISSRCPIVGISLDRVMQSFQINVIGHMMVLKQLLSNQTIQEGDMFLWVGSIHGVNTEISKSVYCSTKHAQRAFSEVFRQEMKEFKIRSTYIELGYVLTDHAKQGTDYLHFDAENFIKGTSLLSTFDYLIHLPPDMCVEHIKINNRINVEPPRSEVENQSMRHVFKKMGFKIDHHKSAGRSTIMSAKEELQKISAAIEEENKLEDLDFGRSSENRLSDMT